MEICELWDKEFRIILLKKFCDILLLVRLSLGCKDDSTYAN